MQRVRKNLFSISFLHYYAEVHNRYTIGYMFDDSQIMRDEQISEIETLLKLAEEVEYLSLDGNVERRYGFVADDELRLERKRSRDAYALSLAS
jgi:hypothetical protein